MIKNITSVCLIVFLIFSVSSVDARTAPTKMKKKRRMRISSHVYRISKHKRKSHRFRRGNGPDLKTITTESPYKNGPSNGIDPIEVKEL